MTKLIAVLFAAAFVIAALVTPVDAHNQEGVWIKAMHTTTLNLLA